MNSLFIGWGSDIVELADEYNVGAPSGVGRL
jgi:hypothetical protein